MWNLRIKTRMFTHISELLRKKKIFCVRRNFIFNNPKQKELSSTQQRRNGMWILHVRVSCSKFHVVVFISTRLIRKVKLSKTQRSYMKMKKRIQIKSHLNISLRAHKSQDKVDWANNKWNYLFSRFVAVSHIQISYTERDEMKNSKTFFFHTKKIFLRCGAKTMRRKWSWKAKTTSFPTSTTSTSESV